MSHWFRHYGPGWMWEGSCDGWISVGLHLDFKRRKTGADGLPYGPYLALHLGCAILYLGFHPERSLELGR